MRGSNVLIAHVFFNVLGGAEALALTIAKTLRESGFNVTLATCTPPNSRRIKELFGFDLGDFRVRVIGAGPSGLAKLLPRSKFSILRRLATYKEFFEEFLSHASTDYDVVMETQSNMPSPADLSYIHCLMSIGDGTGGFARMLYYGIVKRYANSLRRHFVPGRILTNSTWTAAQIFRAHHIVADVVHPPVDVEYFSRALSSDRRERVIVTVCRFTPEKRVERIVDVAAKLRDYTFIIMGSAGEGSKHVVEGVKRRVKELGLSNVVVKVNVPRDEILEHYRYARYYLHPEYAEHFGMSVVEAMAAGLVPIVYRDGGAWYDVVSRVSGMLGYRTIEEVPNIVRRVDGEHQLYERLRERSAEVSKLFNYGSFKESLLEEVNYVLRVKGVIPES